MIYRPIKRVLDFLIALIALIVLSPFFAVIAILIKTDSKGPVYFRQQRLGKNDVHFTIYKFRTMYVHAPNKIPTHQLQNPDDYITKIGKFLRQTSLDELPQFINVLKGEMSLVGPRPLLENETELNHLRKENEVNRVYPGMTGWAQINGRDQITMEDKLACDIEYVNRMSFCFDTKIFFRTIIYVLKRHGIKEGANDREIN